MYSQRIQQGWSEIVTHKKSYALFGFGELLVTSPPPHQKQNARKSTKNVYIIALFTLRCIHVHHLLQFC